MTEIVDNRAQRDEAARLWQEFCRANAGLYLQVDDDAVLRCAKSGIPIAHGDETVTDDETGEIWLRSALGLPPRPEVVEEHDHMDDENHFDEGA